MKLPKNWKKILSMALFIVLVGLLGWYLYRHWDEMRELLALDGRTVTLMLLFALCGCVMNCVYHRILLSVYGVPLDVVDWMGVVFVANAIAYVLPMRADLIFSATYYKRAKGLAYVKSVSMAAGNVVFGVMFALLQMLAALLCAGFLNGQWPLLLWAVLAAGILCVAVFLWLALRLEDHQPAFVQKHKLLRDVITGFNALLRSRKMLRQLLLCLIVNNVFQILLYMECFRAVGTPVPFHQVLLYNSLSWLSTVLSIVPGNIGLKEAVLGVAASQMGALFQSGVAASLMQRVAVMIVYLVMGLAFAWPVWRRYTRGKKEELSHE
ncbi:MAG: lysylphosphatidylglycerol synthase transmembrane domain-containing protein [Lachnospiraceae bacterium]